MRSLITLLHHILQSVRLNEILVFLCEESPPFPHLQDEEVDQVDHHDHQGHEQEALGSEDGQTALLSTLDVTTFGPGAAADAEGHNGAEHVLKRKYGIFFL